MLLIRLPTCEEEEYHEFIFPKFNVFLLELNFTLCRVDVAAVRVLTGKVR